MYILEVLGRVNISGDWRARNEWLWMIMMAKWYSGSLGLKASWHLSYRWGKTPTRKLVPTGDRTRGLCVTGAHATTSPTAVDSTPWERKQNYIAISPISWQRFMLTTLLMSLSILVILRFRKILSWKNHPGTWTPDCLPKTSATTWLGILIVLRKKWRSPYKKIWTVKS